MAVPTLRTCRWEPKSCKIPVGVAQSLARCIILETLDLRDFADRESAAISCELVPSTYGESMTIDGSPTARFGVFQSLRPITRAGVVRDAVAGFQLAAMNIPQVLGYTKIAGTPIITGFYTLLLPLIAFAAFGSSRYLVVAADSATAAILAGGLASLAPLGSERYVALASLVALLTAGLLLLARLLKLGFVADFLSQTVLLGFLTGVGFQVGIAVTGEMLGIDVHARRTVFQLAEVVRGLGHVHEPTLYISVTALAVIFALRHFAPKIPGPLIAVAGAIAASAQFNLAGRGVDTIGPVAGGLPHLRIPALEWREVELMIPLAFSCLVMIVAQSAATARVYAMRHNQALDEDADLVGLSAANLAAGLTGTFVVNGSPTQTAMVESSGARSQLAQVVTAVMVGLVLLFLTGPLQYLPRCVLGAIVFVIAVRLIDLRGLWKIQRESPGEFLVAVITAAVVVLQGVEQGIVLAMVVSLLRVVHHTYRPHTGVLVMNEKGYWQTLPAVYGTVSEPGMAIYRFGAPLFYANASLFSEEALRLAGPTPSRLRWLIIDSEAITNVDYSAAGVMRDLYRHLAARGVVLVFARVHPVLQADLDRHHITETVGREHLFPRLHDALAAYGEFRQIPSSDSPEGRALH
jgi:sulfate permease, SulP family